MDTRGLLDQLLKSGQSLLLKQQAGDTRRNTSEGSTGQGALGGMLGNLGGVLGGDKGKMLAAGAAGLLLGNKSARKIGGKVITYGGLAALGVLAYKAFDNWRANAGSAPAQEPRTVDRVPADQVEQHSRAILVALVAAAKADGHVDERERELIEGEFTRLSGDQSLQQWLHAELHKPLDPAEVARGASTPEIAAEMYLASVMLVDEQHFMERAYLDELARQLDLPDGLKAELEEQVRQAE